MTDATNDLTARVIYDLPDADYRKAAGVSNSMLKLLRERWSPRWAQARLKKPKPTTEAFAFGKAMHQRILTPHLADSWAVMPEGMTQRTKEGKAFVEGYRARGMDVLSADGNYGAVRLQKTFETFRSHPLAQGIMEDGKPEVSVFAPFSLGGTVLRKARMDWVTAGAALVDFKTSLDASPGCIGKRDEFSATLFDLDYDMQAAYYLDLWNAACPDAPKSEFVFVALDWDDDLELAGVRVLQCDATVIRSGRDKYTEALTKWIECEQRGEWPDYTPEVTMVSVPEFVARKYRIV